LTLRGNKNRPIVKMHIPRVPSNHLVFISPPLKAYSLFLVLRQRLLEDCVPKGITTVTDSRLDVFDPGAVAY